MTVFDPVAGVYVTPDSYEQFTPWSRRGTVERLLHPLDLHELKELHKACAERIAIAEERQR